MRRILLISFMLLSALFTDAWAQDRTVSGKVVDDTGETIPGVNVILKGTTTGATSDIDGSWKLTVPSEGGALVFSFVGMSTQEVEIGARSVIDISMEDDAQQLSEVLVTAQGIQREVKTLGYGISNVSGEELSTSRATNLVNSLQGKVTGVQITNSGGNVGGSSKVIIRGITSLNGNNSPLFVVDGVPISNAQTVQDNDRLANNADPFNGAAVAASPDDIESVSVLKGAAATALYGSRAANGVIMITTKKGKSRKGGGPTITFNSTFRMDKLFRRPDWQNEYSGGALAKYDSSAIGSNWGARIAGQTVSKAVTNEQVALQAFENNVDDFYRTGYTLINNISFSDASERGDYRMSFTHTKQEGILPAAELERYAISLNAGFKHSDFVSSRFSIAYTRSNVMGSGGSGANDDNITTWSQFTRTTDFKVFDPWIDESGNQLNNPDQFTNNYLWTRNENRNERRDDRLIGNFSIVVTPIAGLNITNRFGLDYNNDNRFASNRKGTITRIQGDFNKDNIYRTQFNYDLIGDYSKSFGDIDLLVIAGFNYNKRVFTRNSLFAQDLSVPELFAPGNALNTVPGIDETFQTLFGAYANVELSYKGWATLSVTGRNDWSSTLPLETNSYFYPSVSGAFVFTDAFQIANNILSYGKVRASWAQVGNDTTPYRLLFTFRPETTADGQYGLDLNFPYLGRLGFNKTNTIPEANLLPEEQTSIEFGVELAFLDGRVNLDATYYSTSNVNQILSIPIPESTGFGFRIVNAGELSTKGIEISLGADIIKTDAVTWNTQFNFSSNETIVESLTEGVDRFLMASAFNSVQVVATPGLSPQLFAIPYLRDTTAGSATFGRPVINPATGNRIAGEAQNMGNVLPDYTWGWINTVSYKGITLSFMIDGREGGVLRSATVESLWESGAVAETAVNREGTFIDSQGILENTDGTFRDNDVPTRSAENFWGQLGANSVSEASIFDASFIKLREVAISYSLPRSVLENLPFSRVQFGIEGRNLALLHAHVPHIDPEASLFGSGSAGFGIERNVVPSTRSIGFNIKLGF